MENLNSTLTELKKEVYDKCAFQISDFIAESESKEYNACQFKLNGQNVICRDAKITPKKAGQFVTFWKRIGNNPIEPFCETDGIDYFVVNVRTENHFGQFVFPKSVLIKKGIISTNKKEGKRAFRVYPPWVFVENKQAESTQKWQLNYFLTVDKSTDLNCAIKLYKK